MARHYAKYTDEDVIRYSAEVKSLAGLLRKCGLKATGGNYANMKRKLQKLGLTCDHWKGRGWNKGDQLKDWSNYRKNSSIKPHLINERGHQCEECTRVSWGVSPIPLELHHVDGDNTNNQEGNLQLLCPNCHALTDNYRGKNIK